MSSLIDPEKVMLNLDHLQGTVNRSGQTYEIDAAFDKAILAWIERCRSKKCAAVDTKKKLAIKAPESYVSRKGALDNNNGGGVSRGHK